MCGKSTFFNYIIGKRISIVEDKPGVTRDRVYADATWRDRNFTLVDTGGIEPESEDIIISQMRNQANIAVNIADVIIFLTDIKQGITEYLLCLHKEINVFYGNWFYVKMAIKFISGLLCAE